MLAMISESSPAASLMLPVEHCIYFIYLPKALENLYVTHLILGILATFILLQFCLCRTCYQFWLHSLAKRFEDYFCS